MADGARRVRWAGGAAALGAGLILLGGVLGASPAPAAADELVELDDADVRSPFAAERVRQLNAAVRRSLAAIDAHDDGIGATRASVRSAAASGPGGGRRAEAEAAVARLDALAALAASALADLRAAEAELRAGTEPFNEAVLAGMLAFASDVDAELVRTRDELRAALRGADAASR